MDEPTSATSSFDASLANEVGDRVRQIVEDAEAAAIEAAERVDTEIRDLHDQVHAEGRKHREKAAGQAQAIAADRVRRILELRREIGAHADDLATMADNAETIRAGVAAFLDALSDRADLIAREAEVPETAVAELGVPRETATRRRARKPVDGNGGAPTEGRRFTPTDDPLADTRLSALRMAVAGASRSQLETELTQKLAVEDATAVLDDVFGRPKSPFPKWRAAVKRAG
jgi:hypothetical protein